MNVKRLAASCALAGALWAALQNLAAPEDAAQSALQSPAYAGRIAQRLGKVLPRYHVLQQPLDDDASARAWTNLVTAYDFDHSVFLQSDLDELAEHRDKLDDDILAGATAFGEKLYTRYRERLKERIDYATNLLAEADWDFETNETYRIKRKDAPWPKTREEAEDHWRRRMKNEVLVQMLTRELDAEEKDATLTVGSADTLDPSLVDETLEELDESTDASLTPEQNLIKKYRQYYTFLTQPDEETLLQAYLSSMTRAYDPHSEYMSPMSKEEFDMDMNLTLCGVGAVLTMDDGALKIAEIMPGGPMDLDGRIKKGDKIVGVRQADGEMEDILWQPMKKSIRKIRGAKGTRVTLEILPQSDPSGLTKKRIELVRDVIKLEDLAATGRVENVVLREVPHKLGYVNLPSFYGTMEKHPGEEGFRSCAEDVSKCLADFNAQDVEGLVLDLRGNGGGSLREAVMLSALFVPGGPVVQIRDKSMVSVLPIPRGNPVAFKKPMVVLIDRASASASEIVAGHLRDTGRAIILGDTRTYGKGTVQTVMGLGPEKYGSIKVTTARFYRIDGQSTQVKGVEADIRLPSLLEELDIGEDKMPCALPFTRIRKADYTKVWDLDSYIPELAARSAKRLEKNTRYQKHLAQVEGMKAIGAREEVSLVHDVRKAMMRADRKLREQAEDTTDGKTAAKDQETKDKDAKSSRYRRNQPKRDDVVLDEAFLILADLVELKGDETLPPTRMDWYNALLNW